MNLRAVALLPLLMLACTGTTTTTSNGGTSPPGTTDAAADDGGAPAPDGGPTAVGAVPELAVTKLCTAEDRIDYRAYGAKGPLVGTWDISKVCAENFLDFWNDTFHPANHAIAVVGKARARWVFTDKTLQRTVSWNITETVTISKIMTTETCEQNAARYTKELGGTPSKPFTCKSSASGDTLYACDCDVQLSSVNVDGEQYTDPMPLGYLVSTSGVTTGDGKLDFRSDAATLTTDGEGLTMVLSKR